MKISQNPEVQNFLDALKENDPSKYEIIQSLRALVFEIYPQTTERIIYGGVMFSTPEDWGGLFPSKNHVSFEFSQGFTFNDPGKLLEGGGKFRRHLKLINFSDIEEKQVAFFIKQAF